MTDLKLGAFDRYFSYARPLQASKTNIMAKRKALSNKIRFEVFKRDSFTCQYCGQKAPDVILNIDHILPVKEGGTNELLNLITSCFPCNNGKRARKLDDNSVVARQRDQLQYVQQRKEQIEFMLEWKKSLENVEEEYIQMIISYVENKITPYTLNDNGKTNIIGWLKTFKVEEILISKIKGILHTRRMKPTAQRIAYINGIGRNQIHNWDERLCKIILNQYAKALSNYGKQEFEILDDLENEIKPFTIKARKWDDWKNQMNHWISNIHDWEGDVEIDIKDIDEETEKAIDIDEKIQSDNDFIKDSLEVLKFLAPNFQILKTTYFKKSIII